MFGQAWQTDEPTMTETNETWADLPRNMRAGSLAGYRAGHGPSLLLIHGVGLRLEAWRAMIPPLAQKFTVVAMDMPGHGQSSWTGADTVETFADDFSPLMSELDGPVFVAGHSMGAMLAIELASRHPQVLAIAALNAVYRRSANASRAVLERAQTLAEGGQSDPTPTLHRWFGNAPVGPNASASAACRRWLTDSNRAGYAAAYMAFATHDGPSDDTLSGLTCPALFLTGADEPNSTPAMSLAMASRVKRGHARIVDDAAHMAPMTHGVEIADDLTSFFLGRIGDS